MIKRTPTHTREIDLKIPEHHQQQSLMTTLGIIEGEVLTYLEQRGAMTLHRLTSELEWPSRLVMMAAGALIRQGLVRATQRELEITLEPERTWQIPRRRGLESLVDEWGT